MAEDEYNKKMESLQQYIPFLNNMIVQLKDPRKKNREQQLTKMVSLHSMITDRKKKLKLETLIKCEDVIIKLYDKVKTGSTQLPTIAKLSPLASSTPLSPFTPSSPSPPRDLSITVPVVIPTEKVPESFRSSGSGGMGPSTSTHKPKIDIYSSAADSLKIPSPQKTSVFDRLGKRTPDMSKPPISIEDLEALKDDTGVERLSLNELTDLREKLQKQLKSNEDDDFRKHSINTTVRNTTILTKKAVEKTCAPESKKLEVKMNVKPFSINKPVKVVKEVASIFGNALSSIDNQILSGGKHRDRDKEKVSGGKKESDGEAKDKKSSKSGHKSEHREHRSREHKEHKKSSSVSSSSSKDSKKDDRKSKSGDSYKSKHDKSRRSDSDRKDDTPGKERKELDKKEHKLIENKVCKEVDRKECKDVKLKDIKAVDEVKLKDVDCEKPNDADSKERKDLISNNSKDIPSKDPKQVDGNIRNDVDDNERKEVVKIVPIEENIKDEVGGVGEKDEKVDKIKTDTPVYKRLADKYNPKPRKLNPEVSPSSEPPKKEEVSEVSTLNTPTADKSLKPLMQTPSNVPLLSPACSTNSGDSDMGAPFKHSPFLPQTAPYMGVQQQIPTHVSNILANPNTNNLVSAVVNQFKVRPLMPPNQNFAPPAYNMQPQIPPQPNYNFHNQGPRFWGNQMQTPVPRAEYYPQPRGPRPQTPCPPQNFRGADNADWRRFSWSRDNTRESRDPRVRRESREFERESRSRFRDPRLNRYEETATRSRSRSREDDDGNSFASPLNSLYSNSDHYRTGKGYGVQSFKIPKIRKDETEAAEGDDRKSGATPPKGDESVSVSSTSDQQIEAPESAEITSTNDMQGEEAAPTENAILNKILKTIFENKDNPKLKDELRKVVLDGEEEERLKNAMQQRRLAKMKLRAQRLAKKKELLQKLRLKKMRQTKKAASKKNAAKRKHDKEEVSEEEEVVVTVGERIKSRKRSAALGTPKKKRGKRGELDMLHEDIQDMFIRDAVLTATGKRMCRSGRSEERKPGESGSETPRTTRQRKSVAGRVEFSPDKLRVMRNVRVLIPKISVDKLEMDDEVQRYSLRRNSKANKNYVEPESDDDDKQKDEEEASDSSESEREPSPEKTTSPPPSPKKVKKRMNSWASGVLPKRKKKEQNATESPSKPPKDAEESVLEKSFEFVEPDKNYYSSKPWHCKSRCKLCDFEGMNITLHYRRQHPESETLSARLKPEKAEEAIKESLVWKLDETEDKALAAGKKFDFKCRFCDLNMSSPPANFYDHITTHTGEYRHICTLCSYATCNIKPMRLHYQKEHARERCNKLMLVNTRIYGYICLECNFVQINRKAVENHVNIYHLGEGKKISKIHLSSTDYRWDVAEEKRKNKVKTGAPIEKPVEENKQTVEEPVEKKRKAEESAVKKRKLEEPADIKQKLEEPADNKRKLEEPADNKRKLEEPADNKRKLEEPEDNKQKLEEPADNKRKLEKSADKKRKLEPVKKEKEIDMTVFTCNTDINEENEKIERERLKTMTELNETVKTSRQSLNFVDELSTRLMQEPQDAVVVKSEPPDADFADPVVELMKTKMTEAPPLATTSASMETVQKDNVIIENVIQKLRDILKEEQHQVDEPPPLAPLEEKTPQFRAGFMDVIRADDSYKYVCRVASCQFGATSRDDFLGHWSDDHADVNQNYKVTKCRICQKEVQASDDGDLLHNFFTHVENDHLDRRLLRTRRLSGDCLSATKEINADVEEEENPFPFKIAGVMSLADEDLPPLSPIKDKSPLVESVILRELKVNGADLAVASKCPEAMTKFLQCPRELYKCPQFFCNYCTNGRQLFEVHIKAHARPSDELVRCVYCEVRTPLNHAGLHIDLRHFNSLFSCSVCLYRALLREYVMVHMKMRHKDCNTIISLPRKIARSIVTSKGKTFTVKESCPAYVCGHRGCKLQFLYQDEFVKHMEDDHKGILICGFETCRYKCIVADNLIDHCRLHLCYHFHCLMCKSFGSMELFTMLEHYSVAHSGNSPMVVDRRTAPKGERWFYTEEAIGEVKYIRRELLDSVNPKLYQMVSTSELDETKPPIAEVQDTLAVVEEDPPAEFAIAEEKAFDVDPLSADNDATASGHESDSTDMENAQTSKCYGLVGYQLYRCAFCDISFSKSRGFKAHCINSTQCRSEKDAPKTLQCVHCKKMFKSPHGLMEHIQYHGPLRFGCSLCIRKFLSLFALRVHMRHKHNVTNTVTTPVVFNKADLERDEFVLRPVPVSEDEVPLNSPTSTKSVKPAYGPGEVDQIPKRYIFSSDIKCAVCSYSTKVRTNLVRHLQFHSAEKSAPDIAPVNPVPCLDKNEKMFDKMTNLAISSFTSGRMAGAKVEPRAEKQVEVPEYVPSNRRYVCCAPGCNYLCLEEANLRHHLFALHVQEPAFTCAHCKATLKTDVDGFLKHLKLHDLHLYKCSACPFVHNLRHKVDKHASDKHADAATVTARFMDAEVADKSEPQQQSETSAPSATPNLKWTKPWHCGMCKYRCAAKKEILAHIFNKHDINMQYKCTLCSYKNDDVATFDSHFAEAHPDNKTDVIHVYYKSDTGPGDGQIEKQFDTTPLWQRDRPRVRHIRGILFEESGRGDKTPTKKSEPKKSATVVTIDASPTASNLDLAIEAVATGVDSYTMANKQQMQEAEKEKERKLEESVILIDDEADDDDESMVIDVEVVDTNAEPEKVKLSEEGLLEKYGNMKIPSWLKFFKCNICKFKTRKVAAFLVHLLEELKCYRFECTICHCKFVMFDSFTEHCQREHSGVVDGNWTEISLDKSLIYWMQLWIKQQAKAVCRDMTQSQESVSPAFKAQCEYCGLWFRNIQLKEHQLVHWAEHTYKCGHCSSDHSTMNELFEHSALVHPDLECWMKVNGPSVEDVIRDANGAIKEAAKSGGSNEEALFACSSCPEVVKSVELLKKHFDECHDKEVEELAFKAAKSTRVEIFACNYCHVRGSEAFLNEHHKEKHKNWKYDIYLFICLECGSTFKNIKDIRGHFTKNHTGKKLSYSCVERKESGDVEQYCCTKCPFRSNTVGGMRSHLRKHLKPLDCSTCGATFTYPTEAREHLKKEHPEDPEVFEENQGRLAEYEELVKQIVSARDKGIKPKPQRKMLARKSTGAPFVRKEADLGNVTTSTE